MSALAAFPESLLFGSIDWPLLSPTEIMSSKARLVQRSLTVTCCLLLRWHEGALRLSSCCLLLGGCEGGRASEILHVMYWSPQVKQGLILPTDELLHPFGLLVSLEGLKQVCPRIPAPHWFQQCVMYLVHLQTKKNKKTKTKHLENSSWGKQTMEKGEGGRSCAQPKLRFGPEVIPTAQVGFFRTFEWEEQWKRHYTNYAQWT